MICQMLSDVGRHVSSLAETSAPRSLGPHGKSRAGFEPRGLFVSKE